MIYFNCNRVGLDKVPQTAPFIVISEVNPVSQAHWDLTLGVKTQEDVDKLVDNLNRIALELQVAWKTYEDQKEVPNA